MDSGVAYGHNVLDSDLFWIVHYISTIRFDIKVPTTSQLGAGVFGMSPVPHTVWRALVSDVPSHSSDNSPYVGADLSSA